VVATRRIAALKPRRAFPRFPRKPRWHERGRFEHRSGQWGTASAARGHKTRFHDPCFRIAGSQTSGRQFGPNLSGAISRNRPDFEPICLCQRNSLARFCRRSKTRQRDHRNPQYREDRKGCKRFDHWGLLTVGRAIPFASGIIQSTTFAMNGSVTTTYICDSHPICAKVQTDLPFQGEVICFPSGFKIFTNSACTNSLPQIRLPDFSGSSSPSMPETMPPDSRTMIWPAAMSQGCRLRSQ